MCAIRGNRRGYDFCFYLIACIALSLCVGGCSNGLSPNSVSAPSNLVYPTTSISAIVGTAIAADTPTVTGTVSAYSISPSLPSGLSFSITTGAIAGTPTAASSQTAYTVTATNSSGATQTSVQIVVAIAAPSNLTYPTTTITATVGTAIAADTPTVTGTVSAYSISPSLPAGLSFSTTTGAISGTPTAASSQVNYTITATNSGGSTQASVSITVASGSTLTYPQTSITTTPGTAIVTDVPAVTGAVTSFAISPSLPAGLSFSTTTGAISGTPTAVASQTTYTVTANGTAATATVQLAVNSSSAAVLLDLGHAKSITYLKDLSTTLLSQDSSGHWVYWNTTTASQIASGEAIASPGWPVDVAGTTLATGVTNGVEIRSAVNGSISRIISSPLLDPASTATKAWWKLSLDGSYICAGSTQGLAIWSTSGSLIATRTGDYSAAKVAAVSGQLQIALGAGGSSVIETISTTTGQSTLSPAFLGTFSFWFADGGRFITIQNSLNVYTYSASGVQQSGYTMSTNLTGGYGNWAYYVYPPSEAIEIYAANSNTLAYIFDLIGFGPFPNSSTGMLCSQDYAVDMNAGSLSQAFFSYSPTINATICSAASTTEMAVGDANGAIQLLTQGTTKPIVLSYGSVLSAAGASYKAAVSVDGGATFVFDPATSMLQNSFPWGVSLLSLSSDGTVLAAGSSLYSLPSGSSISLYDQSSYGYLLTDAQLSTSGTALSSIWYPEHSTVKTLSGVITSQSGNLLWSYSTYFPALSNNTAAAPLSPDGTEYAFFTQGTAGTCGTTNNFVWLATIYQNGVLQTPIALFGAPIVWLDNTHLLVDTYASSCNGGAYTGAVIYSPTGVQLSTPSLPDMFLNYRHISVVSPTSIYDPLTNTIYSTSTGSATFTGSLPTSGVGAATANYAIYATGHRVVVEPHN